MRLSLIVAMASNRAIGLNKQMPWHLSADLKKFKQITMGAPILMGRKTFESIGKPLVGRTNIIISRNPKYQQQGCFVFNSIEVALKTYHAEPEVFIIGGASFYKAMLPLADRLYLTDIHQVFEADTFFPEINRSQWQEVAREDINNDNSVDFKYSFLTLERLKTG